MTNSLVSGKHILIVDDEVFVGADLEHVLRDQGAEVTLLTTSEEALASLASKRFDAAILDVQLEEDSTYAIADELRRQSTPFVFHSGYFTIREDYTEIPFLPKPFTPETLTTALAHLFPTPTH